MTSIDECQRDEPLFCSHERISSNPAQVTGVSQRHRSQPMFLCLFHSQLNRKTAAQLTQSTSPINDSSTRSFANDSGCPLHLGSPIPNCLDILDVADHSVRIMAKQVGLHQMVDNEASIFGRAASSFEELAADLAQRIGLESRHKTPFVFRDLKD